MIPVHKITLVLELIYIKAQVTNPCPVRYLFDSCYQSKSILKYSASQSTTIPSALAINLGPLDARHYYFIWWNRKNPCFKLLHRQTQEDFKKHLHRRKNSSSLQTKQGANERTVSSARDDIIPAFHTLWFDRNRISLDPLSVLL